MKELLVAVLSTITKTLSALSRNPEIATLVILAVFCLAGFIVGAIVF